MNVYLASSSPRRRELLEQVGIAYTVVSSSYEEDNERPLDPIELVRVQAAGKAASANAPNGDRPIVGADTIVVLHGKVLGKPKDEKEAKAMLRSLSGREHEVITGMAILYKEKMESLAVITKVQFFPLSEKEIEEYVASGEPMDKAGAYGIQGLGARFVAGIAGSYTNVVGLPVERLWSILKRYEEGDR